MKSQALPLHLFVLMITAAGCSQKTTGTVLSSALTAPQTQTIDFSTLAPNEALSYHIGFVGSAQTVTAGDCSRVVEVQIQGASGAPVNTAFNLGVVLSATSVSFYADAECTAGMSSLVISGGSNSASFYFKSTTAGAATISVAMDFNPTITGSQGETIVATAPTPSPSPSSSPSPKPSASPSPKPSPSPRPSPSASPSPSPSSTPVGSAGKSWYVRKGATGANNGSDWNNAWNELSKINFKSVACGDTIWLGGGTYSSDLDIAKTCTSGAPLLIQSVLASDSVPTSAAGYTTAVLDQVIILNNEIDFQSGSYVTVSGRQGSPGGTPFGISVQCNMPSGGCQGVSGGESGDLNFITMKFIEVLGPSCVVTPNPDSGTCTGNADGINLINTNNNTLIDHVYVHQWAEDIRCAGWDNATIQYSWISDTGFTHEEHEDIVYSYANTNLTMRYNMIWGSPNDGIFFDGGGTTNFQFYGNVYFHSGGQLITFKPGYSWGTVYLYNNVFENDGRFGDYQPGWLDLGSASGGTFENNVFENITLSSGCPGTCNYNAYSTSIGKQDNGANSFTYKAGTLFINEDATDPDNGESNFRLTSTGITLLQHGVTLPAPYNLDPDGNTRGAGGAWEIGAYQ